MNIILDNWYVIFGILAVLIVAVIMIIRFFNLPTDKQIENVKEWLKWAVVAAEKELGTGTGQLKLRMVYDMAVSQFDWIAKLIPFEEFSSWVDEALEWMNKQLFTNPNVKQLVEGERYGSK